jgi:prephenate dehydrogenase
VQQRIALIGYGGFGRAFSSLLTPAGYSWRAMDPTAEVPEAHRAPSTEALLAEAGLVVLAVPVPGMRAVLQTLRPHLRPTHLVLDVGSVKVKPVHMLAEVLGTEVPWVGTHPLFGPRSLALGERPLRVVVCPQPLHPNATPRACAFYESLGCEVIEQTAEAHDRVMAYTHALTFFVARGMLDTGMGLSMAFVPPSFKALARTIDTVRADAGHLFQAIQHENPFSSEARQHLLKALTDIHAGLEALPPQQGLPRPEELPSLEASTPALEEVREQVEALDQELVELLARRVQLARRAAELKAQAGQDVPEPAREERLLASRREQATARGLEPERMDAVFRAILRLTDARLTRP